MTEVTFCLAFGLGIFIGIGLTMLAQAFYYADEDICDWEDEED